MTMMVLGAKKYDDRVKLDVEEDGVRRSIVIYFDPIESFWLMRWQENARHLDMTDIGTGLHQIARRVWRDALVEYPLEARFRAEWHPDPGV
jgi:hypothetical protein